VNWVNYDDVLAQLRASGLVVAAITAADIGERRRCRVDGDREKRGWYHLHELRMDNGSTVLVGSYGIWRGSDPGSTKVSIRGQTLTPDQVSALKERIKQDGARERARRQAEGERAMRRASTMWQRLSEQGSSDYLERKGVQGFGVRYSPAGALVIPMLDVQGQVRGLQLIYPKGSERAKRLGRDKDFWPTGLVKQSHFFLIGSPAAGGVILLTEGYATGASLHMATGLPVAIAFDAGNLQHVAKVLGGRYRRARLLVCADDDYLGKCRACGKLTSTAVLACSHCGVDDSGARNAGQAGAEQAALVADGHAIAPVFSSDRPTDRKGPTDFNDLHLAEGLHVVRHQVETQLSALGWVASGAKPPPASTAGEGEGADGDLTVITTVEQLLERYALVYEMTDTVFDAQEHKLVPLGSMRNLCVSRQIHRWWMESLGKRVVRVAEVGFDPTGRDLRVKCNLWGGWPTKPRAGVCTELLGLLEYLCSDDARSRELFNWVLKWLAYPIQHPGAKMQTALVLHGPQGTGKNLFFEGAYMRIFGEYGRVIDQEAIEDKFNDTFSRKLFVVADEVVARQELFHTKNKLKGLVTGESIRINPKNVGAYFETNHLNLVFLSNEPQPMVLERDDRRYCIIWTPPKLDADFYHRVVAEIADGGIEALHDYLLHLDLGDFGPATKPPMTAAKADLIELSLDSSERFYNQWLAGELPLPVGPARTEDLYDSYRHWGTRDGIAKPAQKSTFIGAISKRPGVLKRRHHHFQNHSLTVETQSTVLWPAGVERDQGKAELSKLLANFTDAALRYRDPRRSTAAGGPEDPPAPPRGADDDF
jgi:putative DNA primase/helicase